MQGSYNENLEQKYKVPDWVFYRLYGDKTFVYNTEASQTFVFNAIVKYILDDCCEYKSPREVSDHLIQMFDFGDLEDYEVQNEIEGFIKNLHTENILVKENELSENNGNDFEFSLRRVHIPDAQLISAQIELTYRCQERCRYCYCVTDKPTREELSTPEIKRLLDELSDMNVLDVIFTGGDLFVREDAFELLDYAHSKRFLIDVFTNGIALTDADLIHLKSLHLRSIQFTIYSHIPEKHDAFTQVNGSFEKTIKKCVTLGIPVNIKAMAMKCNKDDLENILLLAKELGATIQVGMYVSATNNGDLKPTKYRFECTQDYIDAMKLVNKYTHSNNYPVDPFTDEDPICTAGTSTIYINPYGDVFACNSLILSCGNIKDKSVREIWHNSEIINKIRRLKKKDIKCLQKCEKSKFCDFCPGSALLESGDWLQKYDEACRFAEAKMVLNS